MTVLYTGSMVQIALRIAEDQGKRLPIFSLDTNRQMAPRVNDKSQKSLAYRDRRCNIGLRAKSILMLSRSWFPFLSHLSGLHLCIDWLLEPILS